MDDGTIGLRRIDFLCQRGLFQNDTPGPLSNFLSNFVMYVCLLRLKVLTESTSTAELANTPERHLVRPGKAL